MKTHGVFRNGQFVWLNEEEYQEHLAEKAPKQAFHAWLDVPEIIEPVTFRPLEGRTARREFMKKHNLVEVGNERTPRKPGGYTFD